MSDRVVVEFGDPDPVLVGFLLLTDLIEDGAIRIEDLDFTHSIDGVASTVVPRRVHPALDPLAQFASGKIDRTTLDAVAQNLPHGKTAAVVLYQGEAMSQVVDLWRTGGASVTTGPAA